ncbi:hypothetical protein C8J56DRAFT_930848 [Mycena floridula]|nr:hypothetical protein C8J56DRAFT_930848 [Mycena floridula]
MPQRPPTIPEYPQKIKCRTMMCNNEGTKTCSRCKGANPETRYCGKKCQTDDWKWHKSYCGKKVYTFRIELLGSKDPVITRLVDVPAWYTFQYFHFVLQYAFGPWQQSHLHQWSFSPAKPNRSGCISLERDQSVLKMIAADDHIEDPLFGGPRIPWMYEKNVKLSDIYDESGRYFKMVQENGEVLPLTYLYDFGVCFPRCLPFLLKYLSRTTGSTLSSSRDPRWHPATGLSSSQPLVILQRKMQVASLAGKRSRRPFELNDQPLPNESDANGLSTA